MSETASAFTWVSTMMQGDAPLMAAAVGGIYREYAPVDTIPPFALVSQQAGTDTLTVNAVRLFERLIFQIKAIGPSGPAGNYAALVTIANRIDALFGRIGPITLSTGGVLACWREQSIAYGELINGAPWSHIGGLYTILLQGS